MKGCLLTVVRMDGDALYSIEVSELEGIIEGDVVLEQKLVREVFN